MTLKYPKNLNEGNVDYVVFRHAEYRTNRNVVGGNQGPDDAAGNRTPRTPLNDLRTPNRFPPAAAGAQDIILYMPNSSVPTGQSQAWGSVEFQGVLGQLQGNIASGLTNEVMNLKGSDFQSKGAADQKITDLVDQFKEQATGVKKNFAGGARQIGVQAIAGAMGFKDPNQLMAMSRGEIFNPNVELLYSGPKMRSPFNFMFSFLPKNRDEASEVNRIIMEFKKFSAPSDTGNGMYKVPHIWMIEYSSANGQNKYLNLFKSCALTNVTVQNNPSLDHHMSYTDGQPLMTALTLQFQEVDIITREDQEEASNMVGY